MGDKLIIAVFLIAFIGVAITECSEAAPNYDQVTKWHNINDYWVRKQISAKEFELKVFLDERTKKATVYECYEIENVRYIKCLSSEEPKNKFLMYDQRKNEVIFTGMK